MINNRRRRWTPPERQALAPDAALAQLRAQWKGADANGRAEIAALAEAVKIVAAGLTRDDQPGVASGR